MSQLIRFILREDVALVARFAMVAQKTPEVYRQRSTEQLQALRAKLAQYDTNGDELVFEQPKVGDPLRRFDDDELPSMIERGELDQKLLGHRFFKLYLNPVLNLLDQILGERELDALMQGLAQ